MNSGETAPHGARLTPKPGSAPRDLPSKSRNMRDERDKGYPATEQAQYVRGKLALQTE